MKIVFGTVIYNSALKYLGDFFQSLDNQDNQNFDLLCVNDDINENVMNEIINYKSEVFGNKKVVFHNSPKGSRIFELRIQLILEAKKSGYDLLVFGDCDDTFSSNRVSTIIRDFDSNDDFGYNEIRTFDGMLVMPSLPKTVNAIKDIIDYNFLGLSNTYINLNKLEILFINSLYEGNTNIFDWYLFSRLLLKGGKGKLLKDTTTYYRIHENNMAGIHDVTKEKIKSEFKVKNNHYEILVKYNELFEYKLEECKAIQKKYGEHLEGLIKDIERDKLYYWWGIIDINSLPKGDKDV